MGKKKRIIASILTILCMALAAAGCGKVSVGYVDQARVQQEAPQIKAKMDAALGDIAKEKKLDTVVNSNTKDGVIITGGVDVTDEVISKLQ